MTKNIVVGTDGSASGTAAVRWAAREAVREDAVLRIVHAFEGSMGLSPDVARKLAEAVTLSAAQEAIGVRVEQDPVLGDAAPLLIDAGMDAALVVVGSRGRGGFAGLHLGSVSQRVAMHAPSNVVVVRGRTQPDVGPVVVGVDEAGHTDEALRAAFIQAHAHSAELVAVRTYLPIIPAWYGMVYTVDVLGMDATEQSDVERLLAPWRQKFPDVPVTIRIAHGSPAAVLTDLSRTARLVVVGSRGRGTVTGTLLGSTGLQLLHHAECPVLIARV